MKKKIKPVFIGFTNRTHIALIHWYEGEEKVHETPCFSEQDITFNLKRKLDPAGPYFNWEPVVERYNRSPVAA